MPSILVLFNLKPGVEPADYERWARQRDLPTVRGLASVQRFDVLRAQGLLMGDGPPPYRYAEIIDVPDMAAFGVEVSGAAVQAGAAQFREFAADPVFIVCETL